MKITINNLPPGWDRLPDGWDDIHWNIYLKRMNKFNKTLDENKQFLCLDAYNKQIKMTGCWICNKPTRSHSICIPDLSTFKCYNVEIEIYIVCDYCFNTLLLADKIDLTLAIQQRSKIES